MDMNKPVAIPFAWYCAWLGKDDEPVWEQYEECHPASKEWDNFPDKIIPLYTHPVKELTDEEIEEMAKRKANQILMDLLMPDVGNERRIDWNVGCTREHLKNFAKAILRKVQET